MTRTNRPLALLMACALTAALPDSGRGETALRHTVSPGGISRFAVGEWGILTVEVTNASDQAQEAFVVGFFEGERNLQYGRRLWVPPRSARRSWFPVLVPKTVAKIDRAEFRSSLLAQAGDAELIVEADFGERFDSIYLPLSADPVLTEAIADLQVGGQSDWLDAIAIMRGAAGHSSRAPMPRIDFLPVMAEAWQVADHLFLLDDRVAGDPAALIAVRQWLHAGGSLWVPLDQVESATMELLLGDAFDCHVVDRVSLTEVLIEGAQLAVAEPRARRFEDPVDLVRVEPGTADVLFRVDGWPAAMLKQVGRGRVVLTTLAARGWLTAPDETDPVRTGTKGGQSTNELTRLAGVYLPSPVEPPLQPARFESFVHDLVGYRIVGRTPVTAILGAFCGGLLLAGIALARRERLEAIGWVGPLLAVASGSLLIGIGLQTRRAVPATVAVAQFIEVDPATDQLHTTGLVGLYRPEPGPVPLGSDEGRVMQPWQEHSGNTRRMIWTDLDAWHFENLKLPAGVQTVAVSETAVSSEPIRATVTFGPEGVEGRLMAGPLTGLNDALIATDRPETLSIRLNDEGRFSAGPADVQPQGRFLAETLLDQTQQRRAATFQQLLHSERSHKYPARPTLFAWSKEVPTGLTLPQGLDVRSSSLAGIPVAITRPAEGTRMVIPSPFLSCRAVPDPGVGGLSSAYDNRKGTWQDQRTAGRTWLRFQFPVELLPVSPTSGTLHVSIKAPLRTTRISTGTIERMVPLVERPGMVGRFNLPVDSPDGLQTDADGGVYVLLEVGELRAQTELATAEFWKVDELGLELTAETVPESAPE